MGPPGHPPRRRGPLGWHFDIDEYLNPFFPPFVLHHLPSCVSHFLGHRTHAPRHSIGNVLMIFWAVVGIFASLACIGAISASVPAFKEIGVPTIIGSFGAAAVLDFYAIESPLAQPRNAILGQFVSAAIGVAISKLFALSSNLDGLRWLGGALSCACATALMALTGTVHPPAGATALMVVVDPSMSALGWFVFAPIALGCGAMLVVALLVNNIQRRFPFYWWSPGETGLFWRRWWERRMEGEKEQGQEAEKGRGFGGKDMLEARRDGRAGQRPLGAEKGGDSSDSLVGDPEAGQGRLSRTVSVLRGRKGEIVIRRGHVIIPEGLELRPEEILSLETLSERL